jgi:hypothetical protein
MIAEVFDQWYCVVTIRSRAVRYVGTDAYAAAVHLNPGTCFGKGMDETEARDNALVSAERLLSAAKLRRDPMYT